MLATRPAQYLLRFDDLCPSMKAGRFERFVPLFDEYNIRPILAVVPDNRDQELNCSEPDPAFWSNIRALEAAGAAIALHGYQHLCRTRAKSLVPLHSHSEFAGVPADLQRRWIHTGLDILRGHGLNPRVWVAPRHGFDRNTLAALRAEGILILSDGLARMPFKRGGLAWLPQQLWSPVAKSAGLWTICLHANTAGPDQVEELRAFLRVHAARFTSVERVLSEFNPVRPGILEGIYEAMTLWRVRSSRALRRLSR